MYAKHLASTHYRCNKFKRNNQGCLFRKSLRGRQRLRFIVVHHSRTKRQQNSPPFQRNTTSAHLTTPLSRFPPFEKSQQWLKKLERLCACQNRKHSVRGAGRSARPAAPQNGLQRLPSLRLWPSSFPLPGFYTAILAL